MGRNRNIRLDDENEFDYDELIAITGHCPTTEERNAMPAQKLSAKEAAIKLGTNARTLRKFLRSKSSPFSPVGQGNRYEFTAGDVKKMKKAFEKWNKAGDDAKAKTPNVPDRVEDDDTDADSVDEAEAMVADADAELTLDDLDGPDEEELDDEVDPELDEDEDDIEVEDID